jgi:hypothetical protein
MGRIKGEGRIVTTVTVTPVFFELAKQNNISFTEAVRVGISIMLAEKGVSEYDNNLNITRLLTETKLKAAEYARKVSELEEKYNARGN